MSVEPSFIKQRWGIIILFSRLLLKMLIKIRQSYKEFLKWGFWEPLKCFYTTKPPSMSFVDRVLHQTVSWNTFWETLPVTNYKAKRDSGGGAVGVQVNFLTTSSPNWGTEALVSANYRGANTSTIAGFQLQTGRRWTQIWEQMPTIGSRTTEVWGEKAIPSWEAGGQREPLGLIHSLYPVWFFLWPTDKLRQPGRFRICCMENCIAT